MKQCPLCKHENDDSVRFCTECQYRFGAPVPVAPPKSDPSARAESSAQPAADGKPSPPAVVPERSSNGAPPSRPVVRQHTTFKRVPASEGQLAPPSNGETAGRKIVGIVITYTWKPEGQLFPICEGRNLIGRDPNQCEIAVPGDSSLSGRNTIITYRSGFRIADDDSMSGTYVDGEALELRESRPLQNYSTIRTGSTDWLFIAIEPTGSL